MSQALAPAIQAVIDAGIPVVTVDRAVEGVETLGHVGADNVRGGEKQGEYLMEILPEGGKIIELQGTVGASPAIDRSAGFNSVIADHPEYEIVFQQTADFLRDQGLTVTEQALQANPDVDAIVAANDDMALGAAEAAAGAGIDVPIIGFDALPEALQAIQDGTLAATVEQWPGRQTAGAMEVLVNLPPRRHRAGGAHHVDRAGADHRRQPRRGRARRRGWHHPHRGWGHPGGSRGHPSGVSLG